MSITLDHDRALEQLEDYGRDQGRCEICGCLRSDCGCFAQKPARTLTTTEIRTLTFRHGVDGKPCPCRLCQPNGSRHA